MNAFRNSFGLILLTLAIVAASTTAEAQSRIMWQGTVKPERINTYASPSISDSVTAMLKQGDVVDVVLEIAVLGNAWCRVGPSGLSEPLGYVLCFNLEKSHFTPKQIAYSESRAATVSAEPISASSTAGPISGTKVVDSAVLTNKDILDLNKIGLQPEILIAKIKSSSCNFDTSPASLQALKAAGLANSVILAMVEAPVGQPNAATALDPPDPASTSSHPSATITPKDGKIRVLVTDSQSWETRGGGSAGGNRNGWGGSSWIAGGARPQTVEIIKTLNQRCPDLTVTNNLEKADFVITLDHEGGKGLFSRRNKIAVFNRDGDDIFSNSTVELGSSVKDACQAILSDVRK